MKTAVIAIALLGLFAGASALDFDSFTAKYSKTYHSMDERSARKAIFTANVAKVESLNAEARANGAEEVFGMSPFLDMTTEEFKAHLGLKGDLGFEADVPVHKTSSLKSAPSSMDWRQKGAVTPVKNQEQCGSCWAFSATESIESCNFIAGNPLDVLAPEQIVDCDTTCDGCQGGLPSSAFKYVMGAGGLEWSKDYPYTAGGGQAGQCNFQKSDVAETIAGWSYATQEKSETAMMDAMATKGPLSVCVDASAWQFYSGGVMQPSSCGTQLDHAVQAVGYTGEYWIVRNSWGASWGEQGYIRLAYGKNTCGVAQLPTYCTARKA